MLLVVGIWWQVSAKKWFKGTVRQVDLKDAGLAQEPGP